MKFSIIMPIVLGLLPDPRQGAHARAQISTKQGGHKFKLSGFDDGRPTRFRVSFWDDSLTGSSYRFDEHGYLRYFKAGSKVYYDVHNGYSSGSVAFSVKDESKADKLAGEVHDGLHEPFTCRQCADMLSGVCSSNGLPGFCDNVDMPSLGTDDGVASVSILCNSAIDICANAVSACESLCASGQWHVQEGSSHTGPQAALPQQSKSH